MATISLLSIIADAREWALDAAQEELYHGFGEEHS